MGNCIRSKPKNNSVQAAEVYPENDIALSSMPAPSRQVSQQVIAVPKVPKMKKKVRDTVKLVSHKSDDQEGRKMINEYVFDEFLGQGSFGKVKLAFKHDKRYAIKILRKSKLKRQREYIKDANGAVQVKDALQDVRREIAIMKKLKHKNIIELFEVIDNPESDKLYMVLEYAPQGQLIEWNDDDEIFEMQLEVTLDEPFLRKLFRDCIQGLDYLHANGIIHRDLKPQNILLGEGTAKIADFGVSVIAGEKDLLQSTQGTYHFMAPEIFNKELLKEGYSGRSADMWALGVTFYAFAFLAVPFNGETVQQIMDNAQNQKLVFPHGSEGMQDLISQLLDKNHQTRPKTQQIAHHPWLNEGYEPLQLSSEATGEISEMEIREAYSLSSIMKIKQWVTKWKTSSNLKKISQI